MSSCFGSRKSRRDADREPLLPKYEDETGLQRRLHQKLHTYQMIRALSQGFMPSTEQAIVNLRTLLASDILNPDNPDLSDSGRRLVRYAKEWLRQFIELVRHKNDRDQVQDFVWYLTQSKISLDVNDLSRQASKVKARADATAAYESLKTVGSLLLTNSDFRLFIDDLGTIGRQVMSDTAFSLSGTAEEAGKKLKPDEGDTKAIQAPGADEGAPPTTDDLGQEVAEVSSIVVNGISKSGQDALTSAKENLAGDQKETLLYRLKQAVVKLRKRNDYSDSVSTIAQLIQRYAMAYSRALDKTISTAREDVETNDALDRAIKNFWTLLSSFGSREEWEKLEQNFKQLMTHSEKDPEFESLMRDLGNAVQKLLTDPDFFDSADRKIQELREKSKQVGTDSNLRQDIDAVLEQSQITLKTVLEDEDIAKLIHTSKNIFQILSPVNNITNPDLLNDSLNIFVPLLIRAVQNVPIPRVEVSVPEMDLLLENVIIEPGRTVNASSFLPYRLLLSTRNDIEIKKAHSKKTVSNLTSLVTVSVNGLSLRATDLGFWLRTHASPFFYFADEGVASFALDERGMDITLDLEVGKEKLEQILTLRAVKVHIHKLDYALRRSKLSWLGWLFKPFLKPLIRRVLEKVLAENISNLLHAANRELVFARERLRATRIADPQDVATFVKAVMARLTPDEDPDVYTRVGVDAPNKGVFKGVYAPGSLVKVWHEEADRAQEHLEEGEERDGGWRNDVFDVGVV